MSEGVKTYARVGYRLGVVEVIVGAFELFRTTRHIISTFAGRGFRCNANSKHSERWDVEGLNKLGPVGHDGRRPGET